MGPRGFFKRSRGCAVGYRSFSKRYRRGKETSSEEAREKVQEGGESPGEMKGLEGVGEEARRGEETPGRMGKVPRGRRARDRLREGGDTSGEMGVVPRDRGRSAEEAKDECCRRGEASGTIGKD